MNQLENKLSSREVCGMMEIRHDHLLQKIDAINLDFREPKIGFSKYWQESTYKVEGQEREYREFQVTKKGCEFLAHKTTGTKGNLFTDKYMDRFTLMEQAIRTGSYNPIGKTRTDEILEIIKTLPTDKYKNKAVAELIRLIPINQNQLPDNGRGNFYFVLDPKLLIKRIQDLHDDHAPSCQFHPIQLQDYQICSV